MKKQFFADMILLLTTLIWGTSFFITKNILNDDTSPLTLMMYRALFSFLLITPIIIRKMMKSKTFYFPQVKYGVKVGVYIFVGFVFQTVGALYTTPSKSAFLTTLNVIFVPLILFLFYKQKINKITAISAFVALIGAFIMSGLTVNGDGNQLELLGDILTFISAIFWALQIIKTGHYAHKVDIWVLMFYEFITMFVLSFLSVIIFKQSMMVSLPSIVGILYLALFCTVICFGLMAYAMRHTRPEKAALIFTFEGVFGALFSILFRVEKMSLYTLLGGAIIFFALVLSETNFKFMKWQRKEKLKCKSEM